MGLGSLIALEKVTERQNLGSSNQLPPAQTTPLHPDQPKAVQNTSTALLEFSFLYIPLLPGSQR